MYVYIFVYVCVIVYVCMYIYVFMYACVYVCMHVCVFVLIYMYTYVCMHAVIQFIPTRSTHVCSVRNRHYVISDERCTNRQRYTQKANGFQHKGPQISSNTVKAAYNYCQSVRI